MPNTVTAEDEVVDLCRELIRIDTSNTGETATSAGERVAAEYVAEKLSEVGLEVTVSESEPTRASVVTRIAGTDSSRPALLLHGHLDVVPAQADDWTHPPFAGEITDDGYLWGRGAVDMKDMDAMILALVRQWKRDGWTPPRDLVVAFFADEEAGSIHGAHHLVETRPELFDGVTEAVSEVGGFSVSLDADRRLYPIQGAERGIGWMKLTATGRAGHGSFIHDDNAVTTLAEAVGRIGRHRFPLQMTDTVAAFLRAAAAELGIEVDLDNPELTVDKLGPISKIIGATLRNTANPTMLSAGYKANVIPGKAEAVIDGRFLPGTQEEFERTIDELAGPDVTREWVGGQAQPALEFPFEGALVDAMTAALIAEDPGARPVPYMLSGGTDGKALNRLGIRSYGFAPLKLPADLDFAALFHGVDERVPTEALRFGVRVLRRFVESA
ncbi:M20/M25/M40 family metallo-hydrolase [Fodinicola acaciae]|uniref:M20/M25/M40 family metallo-hydrolase n=1 Tax=Fodinicola acaciae TaxID=2681555 RepID=UPI0013D44543|nr:M20/M25/M40 family metallo-hydrolase [Fodinicola acaciae]